MNTIIKRTHVRYSILIFLFLATVFNYADRATLSVVAPIMSKELGFDPEALGLAFSVFGISYVIMQIPGGWLLDKYGSRLVYGCALIGWSVVTMFQGTIYLYASPLIVPVVLRLMMGAIEAPAFPANSRLSVQWFPNKERGFVTYLPDKSPSPFTNLPCKSTKGTGVPFSSKTNIGGTSGVAAAATLASSAPNVGAVCTIPVPSSVVTKSPAITRNASSAF